MSVGAWSVGQFTPIIERTDPASIGRKYHRAHARLSRSSRDPSALVVRRVSSTLTRSTVPNGPGRGCRRRECPAWPVGTENVRLGFALLVPSLPVGVQRRIILFLNHHTFAPAATATLRLHASTSATWTCARLHASTSATWTCARQSLTLSLRSDL